MSKIITLPPLDAPEEDVVSRHELVCLLAGDLPRERRATLEDRLARDPALQAKLTQLEEEARADEAALRLEVPLVRFLHDHEDRTSRRWLRWPTLPARSLLGGGALALASLLLAAVVRTPSVPPAHEPAWDGLKGDGRLAFFVRDGAGARVGSAGERLHAGDQIQFAVRDDRSRSSMVLVGLDGRGLVSVYAAEDVRAQGLQGAAPAPASRLLTESIILDDAPGPERFFVVYGDQDVAAVRLAVESAARSLAADGIDLSRADRLPLPSTWTQGSVYIVKERP